jgi:membrane-bound lytic murein transglycosylase D
MEERVRMKRSGVGTALLALSALVGGCATPPSSTPEQSPALTPVTGAVVPTQAAEASSVAATAGPLPPAPVASIPAPSAAQASSPTSSAVSQATGTALGTATPPTAGAPDASISNAPLAPAAQAAPRPVDPLQPDAKIDFDDDKSHADLWLRVRKGFAMPDLDAALVRREEQWYMARPDYVDRMMERGSRYLFHIVGEVEKREFPTELALLPFIESAFNPQAKSSAKATGMWQFMPGTGRHFELKQNVFRDDRRDVVASTRAALDYLGQLYSTFGDWRLALAAYNWGEGNVQRAIAVNRRAGRPTDYLSLRLPNETRSYVPKLQAVKNIVSRPEDFGLTLPPLDNHPYFLSVPIQHDIDVEVAARLAELPIEEFRELNPQMNGPVILAAGTPQILLPYDNANAFVRRVAQHTEPLATWTAWVAPRTLRPSDAARQVGMSEETLREINDIPSGMLVKAGSTLLIERSEHRQSNVSEHIADSGTISFTPDPKVLRRHALRVGRKGDTVTGVARRYGLSTSQVARWNGVGESALFRAGQTVVVFLPQRAPAVRPAATTKSRSSAAGVTSRSAKARRATAARPAARARAAKKPATSPTTVARQ